MKRVTPPDLTRAALLSLLPSEQACLDSLKALRALPCPPIKESHTQADQNDLAPECRAARPNPSLADRFSRGRADQPLSFPCREALLDASAGRMGDFFFIPSKGGEIT